MQQYIKILLFHIYMKLMFRATPPIIRSLKLHWQPLVFHTWKIVGRVVGGRCQAQCACQCNFRLLMMGGVSPETFWASYKYGIIKFWYIVASCWIFLYELYYDARIHEHQAQIGSTSWVAISGWTCTWAILLSYRRKTSVILVVIQYSQENPHAVTVVLLFPEWLLV